MTGSAILKDEIIPEKHLVKKVLYKYTPDNSTLYNMLNDFYRASGVVPQIGDTVEFDITVTIKTYDTKPAPKQFWYDKEIKPTDDTKNT